VGTNNEWNARGFRVYGTDGYGIADFDNYADFEPDWHRYVIPVGQYYTGNFNYLAFLNDDDTAPHGESRYRNVIVYEQGQEGEMRGTVVTVR